MREHARMMLSNMAGHHQLKRETLAGVCQSFDLSLDICREDICFDRKGCVQTEDLPL